MGGNRRLRRRSHQPHRGDHRHDHHPTTIPTTIPDLTNCRTVHHCLRRAAHRLAAAGHQLDPQDHRHAAVRGWRAAAAWTLLFDVALNGYPVALQRYNRGLLHRRYPPDTGAAPPGADRSGPGLAGGGAG